MQKQRSIKDELKDVVRTMRYAKDTQNRERTAYCREIIRMLWRHRHSGKPVSAIIVAQQSRAHLPS